jgi:hypothetical protein
VAQRFKDRAPLTFRALRAILPALMRRLASLALAVAALAGLHGCSNACQDLGDRICACSGGGTSSDTCKQQIKNQLQSVGVKSVDKAICAKALSTCQVPAALVHSPVQVDDAVFCEWLTTPCGKVSCALAYGDPVAVCAQAGP